MKIFTDVLVELKDFLEQRAGKLKVSYCDEETSWKKVDANKGENLILPDDVAIELGYPSRQSVYFLVIIDDKVAKNNKDKDVYEISDGKITLIGNDIPDIKEKNSPFGQIILLRCHGFNNLNFHDRYLELDCIKRHIDLDGYMFRARPDRGREYTRVCKKAVQNGIDFDIIGSEMIRKYKEVEYVDEVEVIFITDEEEDIKTLCPLAKDVIRYVDSTDKGLKKMVLRKYMEGMEQGVQGIEGKGQCKKN